MTQRPSKRQRPAHTGSPRDQPETEQASFKRRRTALACTSCRNRKSRCNGAKPSCSLCMQMGFECIYEQPINSNIGTQPDIRLDNRYEDRFKSIEETLRQLITQQTHQQRAPYRSLDNGRETNILDSSPTEDVAVLSNDEDCLHDASEDRVDGMATIADSDDKDPRYFGPSSNIALLGEVSKMISLALKSKLQFQRDPSSTTEQRLVSRMQSPNQTTALATPRTPAFTNHCALPPWQRATALIEHFFSDTGMLFPYISKSYITSSYEAARTRNFSGVKRSWLCLLNMIFAFATFTKISPHESMENNILSSKPYFNRAHELLFESKFRLADLNLVQCLLLMSQYRQGTQRSDETWSLHALAIHAAIQIGLHCRPDMTRLSQFDIEVRKRTWYGCVVLDSTLSMTLGRPPSIPKDYTILDPPLRENLDDVHRHFTIRQATNTIAKTRTVVFFIATIDLYVIQNEIISKLYYNNLHPDLGTNLTDILTNIVGIEDSLNRWEAKLSPELQLRPWIPTAPTATNEAVFERLSVIIRLRYLHTRILAHRVVLRLLSSCMEESASDCTWESESFSGKASRECMLSCASSAREIIEIVHTMSSVPKKLGSWWFTIYYTFHAILVLVSCLIYHFESVSTNRSILRLHWSRAEIQGFESVLPKALEAIENIGQGTRSSRRICRTLARLNGIYACIVQTVSLNSAASLTFTDDSQPENLRRQATHNSNIGTTYTISAETANIDALSDHPHVFDAESSDFWMQGDLDIFANLGGLDAGLSSILAG